MAKTHDKCKLCGSVRFLNFIGLCKRCNQKKEAGLIVTAAVDKRSKDLASAADAAAKQDVVDAAYAAAHPEPEVVEPEKDAKEKPKEEHKK